MNQFCPVANGEVSPKKCNLCNLELVGRTKYCCRYINCLTTCDYRLKDNCHGFKAALLKQAENAKKQAKPGSN